MSFRRLLKSMVLAGSVSLIVSQTLCADGVNGPIYHRSRFGFTTIAEQPNVGMFGIRDRTRSTVSEPDEPEPTDGDGIPTPGDRPAFEKAEGLVGDEPGELPEWTLTNLWDYDERYGPDRMGRNPLADYQWSLGGSTVQSFVVNTAVPGDQDNGPTTFTDRSNEYQLNQTWLYLERATDTSERDFDFGGRVDILYGTNYRWMTSAGFEDRWSINTNQAFYGVALPNAYLETAYRDVKVKAGHFVSPVGYFTVDTTQNFFFSIPYTYQYGEPFTHWGSLATWTVNDQFTLGGGVTRGWDNFNGSGSGSHGVGGLWTATYAFDNQVSIACVGTVSNEFNHQQNPNINYSNRYLQSVVLSAPLSDSLNYVAQSDFGTQGNAYDSSGTRAIGRARWYGLNQYLFYTVNPCWTWGLNFEWFRDEGGFRVGSVLPTLSTPGSSVSGLPGNRFGYIGNFYQLTVGPKWTPNPNLFVRPNLRADWFQGTAANPGHLQPFNDGQQTNQLIVGLDVGILY
ncbi:MAG: hypothetical protein EXS05_13850 [Planctomycetaceae bacterium]|nr:hypothetical protein [Planctomycetaceae bacterium]